MQLATCSHALGQVGSATAAGPPKPGYCADPPNEVVWIIWDCVACGRGQRRGKSDFRRLLMRLLLRLLLLRCRRRRPAPPHAAPPPQSSWGRHCCSARALWLGGALARVAAAAAAAAAAAGGAWPEVLACIMGTSSSLSLLELILRGAGGSDQALGACKQPTLLPRLHEQCGGLPDDPSPARGRWRGRWRRSASRS